MLVHLRRLPILTATIAVALAQGGCVSLLTSGGAESNFADAKRDHAYDFYVGQTKKLRDLGACREAANYFQSATDPTTSHSIMGSSRSSKLSEENLAALKDRIVDDARTLADTCEKEVLPKLEAARRWEALAGTMKAMAALPLGEADQQALLRRADTVDLLRAKATADDGVADFKAGKYYEALASLSSATSIAKAVKSATDAEKNVYVKLEQDHKDQYVAMLLKQADDAGRKPESAHRALLYIGRAYEVSRDKALAHRLETARAALLASNVYAWQVDFKGDAGISRAAQEKVQSHRFTGNFKAGTAREFAAVINVGPPTVTPTQREASRTGQYVTGSRSVDNPDYRRLQTYVMNQQRCLSGLGGVSYNSNQVWREQEKLGCDYRCTGYECARRKNQALLNDAQAKLSRTSMTNQEDITSPWQYPTQEWSQVIKAPVQLSLKRALESSPKSSTMTLEHTYTDHAHDIVPKLGLAKKTISKKSDQELAEEAGAKLGGQVIETIETDYKTWLASLPKLGERGVVLYMLMNTDGKKLDAEIEKKTGLKNAYNLARQH